MLALKLIKLQAFPGLLKKKKKLETEGVGLQLRLAQHALQRDSVGAVVEDSESTGPTHTSAIGDSSWHKHPCGCTHMFARLRTLTYARTHTHILTPCVRAHVCMHIHARACMRKHAPAEHGCATALAFAIIAEGFLCDGRTPVLIAGYRPFADTECPVCNVQVRLCQLLPMLMPLSTAATLVLRSWPTTTVHASSAPRPSSSCSRCQNLGDEIPFRQGPALRILPRGSFVRERCAPRPRCISGAAAGPSDGQMTVEAHVGI
jgi:hypothetical protein